MVWFCPVNASPRRVLAHERAVVVRSHRHVRLCLESRNQLLGLLTSKRVAQRVQAFAALFERVMAREYLSNGRWADVPRSPWPKFVVSLGLGAKVATLSCGSACSDSRRIFGARVLSRPV